MSSEHANSGFTPFQFMPIFTEFQLVQPFTFMTSGMTTSGETAV